jgi:hypothetical protein
MKRGRQSLSPVHFAAFMIGLIKDVAPDIQNTAIAAVCDVSNGEIDSRSIQRGKDMDMFKIKVARIEMIPPNESGEDVRLTFQFEGGQTTFTLPIFLKSREFDDTEIVKVARSKLHDVFSQLSSQCENWR